MAFYEVVYIVRPDVATTQVDQVTEKVAELVKKGKGKVLKTEQWGLRNLAYRIRKHKKGYYTMLTLDIDGDGLAEVERNLRLADDVIRFLSIKVEEVSDEPSMMMGSPKKGRSRPGTSKPSSDKSTDEDSANA